VRGECTVESQPRHATCELQPNAVGNARCVWRGGATPLDLVLTSCWGRCVSVMYPRLEPSRWSIDDLLPDACASGPPPALCINDRRPQKYRLSRSGGERKEKPRAGDRLRHDAVKLLTFALTPAPPLTICSQARRSGVANASGLLAAARAEVEVGCAHVCDTVVSRTDPPAALSGTPLS